jgi:geranylgeranyl diphosphate synthase type II
VAYPESRRLVAYPDALRLLIEDELERLAFWQDPDIDGLVEAMRYSLLAGGKRIRPVLALATARAIGRDEQELLPLAAAIELIHTDSLIHDDLPAMDDDDMRRGRPTNHVAFGQDVAILAGDALYAEAFRHLLTHQSGEPADVLAAVCELAAATGVNGMVGGQYLDVAGIQLDEPQPARALRRLHELKTGRLIGASVECGDQRQQPSATSPPSSACSFRSSTTSSTSRAPTMRWASPAAATSATASAPT